MSSRLERRYARMPDEKLLRRAEKSERMSDKERVTLLEELSARRLDLPQDEPEEDALELKTLPEKEEKPPISNYQALAQKYAREEDEILEQLAANHDKLIPSARAALAQELRRRKLPGIHPSGKELPKTKYRGPESQRVAEDNFPGAERLFITGEGISLILAIATIMMFSQLIIIGGTMIPILLFGLIWTIYQYASREGRQIQLAVYSNQILFLGKDQLKRSEQKRKNRLREPRDFNEVSFARLKKVSVEKVDGKTCLLFETKTGKNFRATFDGGYGDCLKAVRYLNTRLEEWQQK